MNTVLFVVLPYVALVVALTVSIYRYVVRRFGYSSLSSQFLESNQLMWGSVHFHYGISLILLAHLLAALFPGAWARLLGDTGRLQFLEVTGIVLGIFTILGLAMLIVRRGTNPRVQVVTTRMDWLVLVLLFVQVVLGVWTALIYRWGGVWYLHTAVPWLWSLAKLNPQPNAVLALPWVVKLHFINGFVLIGLFPFTRLVHIVTYPITYLWRPYQVVIWNRRAHLSDAKR